VPLKNSSRTARATRCLEEITGGNQEAVSELMPLVYEELRRLAARYISRERPGQTLQATALVNEAFVRLVGERARGFENRAHFVAIAALSMRQILVQRARARHAAKRGGAAARVTLDEPALQAVADRCLAKNRSTGTRPHRTCLRRWKTCDARSMVSPGVEPHPSSMRLLRRQRP